MNIKKKESAINKCIDINCPIYKVIKSHKLISCNACIGCEYIKTAESACIKNRLNTNIEVCEI